MKRYLRFVGASLAAVIGLLLLIDVHIAYTTSSHEATQAITHGSANPAGVGRNLNVYITGDTTLAGHLRKQLPEAIKAKDLPLQVTFLDQIPANSNETPFLAIHLSVDRGLWTPLYATRHVEAKLYYRQGLPIDSQEILAGQVVINHAFASETCVGECSEGNQQVKLDARALGMVSLPYIRSYAAAQVAEQAATLVAEGVPEHLNPAKWLNRSVAEMGKLYAGRNGGIWTQFRSVPGCWGGVGMGGSYPNDWVVFYYDAESDRFSETLTSKEVAARTPAPAPGTTPPPITFPLPDGHTLTVPPGTCGLTGWQVTH